MSIDQQDAPNPEPNTAVDDGEKIESDTNGVVRIPFSRFLESSPPSKLVNISELTFLRESYSGRKERMLSQPDIELFCAHQVCNGIRVFRAKEHYCELSQKSYTYEHFTYTCSNCQQTTKTYFIALKVDAGDFNCGDAYKFGELPAFGPRTPSKLIGLIGPDRETFLKGRNCEIQGFGIGAFAYYRRVVENQKNRILEEIIRVARRLSASNDAIAALEDAKSEIQFSKAVKLVKEAIPQTLLMSGQNPLTLLYTALSVGLHSRSDDKCLEAAQDIRIVLGELAERIGQALKDEAELNAAVVRLTKSRVEK